MPCRCLFLTLPSAKGTLNLPHPRGLYSRMTFGWPPNFELSWLRRQPVRWDLCGCSPTRQTAAHASQSSSPTLSPPNMQDLNYSDVSLKRHPERNSEATRKEVPCARQQSLSRGRIGHHTAPISTAPTIVEKITINARSLSTARLPGLNRNIRSLVGRLGKDLAG